MRRLFYAIATLLVSATAAVAAPPRIEPIQPMTGNEIRQTISEPTIYTFTGRSGQQVTASLWAGSLSAHVFAPSGEKVATLETELEQKALTLPESGMYRVKVKPTRETTAFVLEFDSLKDSSTAGDRAPGWQFKQPQAIALWKGKANTDVKLNLGKQEIQPLTVAAKAGQRLTVKAAGVDLAIESPSGELLDQGSGETVATLPTSGVYRVLVIARPSTATSVNIQLR